MERNHSPYDIMAITWSMADNCLIDADLPEAVRQWNATYAWPKLIIAGAKEILRAYETKYSSSIPGYKGDFLQSKGSLPPIQVKNLNITRAIPAHESDIPPFELVDLNIHLRLKN